MIGAARKSKKRRKKFPCARRLPRQWHVRHAGFAGCVASRAESFSVVGRPVVDMLLVCKDRCQVVRIPAVSRSCSSKVINIPVVVQRLIPMVLTVKSDHETPQLLKVKEVDAPFAQVVQVVDIPVAEAHPHGLVDHGASPVACLGQGDR